MGNGANEAQICPKCGRKLKLENFYTYKDGNKVELCKKCLTMHIDLTDPDTFLWIMQKLDVPYVPIEWNATIEKDYAKKGDKISPMAVFGKYLSKMKLKQYNGYGWEQSDEANAAAQKASVVAAVVKEAKEEVDANYEQNLRANFENGSITKAEYETLSSATSRLRDQSASVTAPMHNILSPADSSLIENENFFDESNYMPQESMVDIAAGLSDDEKMRLAVKWGRLYKPQEWVQLEDKYNEMMQSFDIQDSDTNGSLVLICKTYLKMNQAIDQGDIDTYNKLSGTYDKLRRSAKFTAAQKTDKAIENLSSVGEIVALCEKEGGFIPKLDITVDKDIIDTVIRDQKKWLQTLIHNDTNLGQKIEQYLMRKESLERSKQDKKQAEALGKDQVEIEDEDYKQYYDMIHREAEKDKEVAGGGE